MNSFATLSAEQFASAAKIKGKIEALESKLDRLLGLGEASTPNRQRVRRKMSVAGRARIAAAARVRWMKYRGSNNLYVPSKTKRRMSAAARAKIAAAAKARWAKVKAAGKNRL